MHTPLFATVAFQGWIGGANGLVGVCTLGEDYKRLLGCRGGVWQIKVQRRGA